MASGHLIRPNVAYQASFMAAVHEFMAEGQTPSWNIENLRANFDEYVQMRRDEALRPLPNQVPATHYWLIDKNEYIGRCSIRHYLTDALTQYGGHIGYEIRPSKRRMGYGVHQCQLAVARAHEMGIHDVLITCDDDNIGSAKIIEACGGVLENRVDNGRHALTRRYWIRKQV